MTLEINNQIQTQNSYMYQTFNHLRSSMSKIMQLALPALGILALSCIPTAEAGQAEYELCIASCPAMAVMASAGSLGGISYEYALRACQLSCNYKLLF